MTANFVQRLAQPADVPRLLELLEAYYRADGMAFVRARIEPALLRLIEEPTLGWVTVVHADGDIHGYLAATLCYSLEFGGQYGLIDEVYLQPESRGQGLGTALLEAFVQTCRTRGLVAVRLEVERGNAAALRLYDRLGFEKHDRDLMTQRLG